jgi:hypothetical protein
MIARAKAQRLGRKTDRIAPAADTAAAGVKHQRPVLFRGPKQRRAGFRSSQDRH